MIDAPTEQAALAARRPGWMAWLLIAPMLLWLLAFVVMPTAILLLVSLSDRGPSGMPNYQFSLRGYADVFDRVYLQILLRSIFWAALTTVICVIVGYPVAYFIGRSSPAWRNRLLLAVMVPFWTNFLIRTYAWMSLLRDHGLINGALKSIGLIAQPLEMLYTPGAVVLGLVYCYLPFMILPIYGSVEKLDGSLVEAAQDLGAGPLRSFLRVVLPMTAPGVAAGVLLVFVPAIGMFAVSRLMGGGQSQMIGDVIEEQFKAAKNWPFGAALGVMLLSLFVACYGLLSRRTPAAWRAGG